jgi:hypothetical protein
VCFNVVLGSVLRMFAGIDMVSVSQVRVMGSCFIVAILVMFSCFVVVARSVLVMFRCLRVML